LSLQLLTWEQQFLQLHLVEFESRRRLANSCSAGFMLLPVQVIAQRQVSEADEDDERIRRCAFAGDRRDDE